MVWKISSTSVRSGSASSTVHPMSPKRATAGPAHVEHGGVDGIAAERRTPRDARPLEVCGRAARGTRLPGVSRDSGTRRSGAGHCREKQGHVLHPPADRAGDAHRVVEHGAGPHRDPSRRRAEAHDVGPRRGVAERPAHVRAVRERQHSARDGDQRRPRCFRRRCDRSRTGFFVAPNTALKVWDPAPNSGVLVLPMMIAPAALQPFDVKLVLVGHEVAVRWASRTWCGCRGSG